MAALDVLVRKHSHAKGRRKTLEIFMGYHVDEVLRGLTGLGHGRTLVYSCILLYLLRKKHSTWDTPGTLGIVHLVIFLQIHYSDDQIHYKTRRLPVLREFRAREGSIAICSSTQVV